MKLMFKYQKPETASIANQLWPHLTKPLG